MAVKGKRREVIELGKVMGYTVYGRDDGSVFAKASDKKQRVDEGWQVVIVPSHGINVPTVSFFTTPQDTPPPDTLLSTITREVHIPVKVKYIRPAPDQTIIVWGGCIVNEDWKVWCLKDIEFWRFKYSNKRPYERVGFWELEE